MNIKLFRNLVKAEANREKLIKIRESLNNYFVFCVKKAEFEKEMTQVSSLVSKANTVKGRSEEFSKKPRN